VVVVALLKLFSMQGNLSAPGEANTGNVLTTLGGVSNIDYIARTSNFLRIVVSWAALQNADPGAQAKSSLPAYWTSLDQSPGWPYLDAQIKAANDRGLPVVLTINCDGTPLWAVSSSAMARYQDVNAHRPWDLPSDFRLTRLTPAGVDPSSWFAWFLSYVVARYKPRLPAGRAPWGAWGFAAGNPL